MRLAVVVPRYGEQVVGGAERALRLYGERLAETTGWEIEAFTSCALDHLTWEDVLEPGDELVNGVVVHRFSCGPSLLERYPEFGGPVVAHPDAATLPDADRWIDLQGPRCPALLDALDDWRPDVAVFSPYLYAPAVRGVARLGSRAVLHPAAHDEPLLDLAVFDGVFAAAGGLAYYSEEERSLVERRFRVADRPALVAGVGVDDPPLGGSLPADLAGRPYLLSLSRVEANKGSLLLARAFAVYKARRPGPLALAFAGPAGTLAPAERDDVVMLGQVDEATKGALLRGARALVHPSPFESFSLVLMEAWASGTPVLVNGRCAVTRGHCIRSGGGLSFDDYAAFEAALDRLVGDDDVCGRLAVAGRAYVDARYRWPVVLDRYRLFLERVAAA